MPQATYPDSERLKKLSDSKRAKTMGDRGMGLHNKLYCYRWDLDLGRLFSPV